jgi:tRNA-2-methylthio-N6-dimethylallyladenosine synthase
MEIKKKRLEEIVSLQNHLSLETNKLDIGKKVEVLIEGNSKKNEKQWMGRNSQNKVVVFDKTDKALQPGDYVWVEVKDCTQGTLLGNMVS